MALAILDGTQTATTLSTILSSGQHITAHTVVSLGTQAKTDILSAVSSGIAISGTVTAKMQGSFSGSYLDIAVNDQGYLSVNVDNQISISELPSLPSGTNRIGVVTIGAGTVTIGAGTAQIGSVTASISNTVPISISSVTIGNFPATQAISISSVTIGNTVTISGTVTANPTGTQTIAGSVTLGASTSQIGSVTAYISNFPATQAISISSVTVGNSVTIASLPAISGTVTANPSISSTVITSGSFTSLTSATLVPANTARKMATVYNLGAGQLFVNAGVTATTLGGGFMVALSSGDFYECNYTTTTLSAIFATAGTASWVSH
jgi:hypothetical protein